MRNVRIIVSWALGLLSAYMIFKGAVIFVSTSGFVQGSEFGMLITLAHQFGIVMVWLALFALHVLLGSGSVSIPPQKD